MDEKHSPAHVRPETKLQPAHQHHAHRAGHTRTKKSDFKLQDSLRLAWHFLPEWIHPSLLLASSVDADSESKASADGHGEIEQSRILGEVAWLPVRTKEVEFLQRVSTLANEIATFCQRGLQSGVAQTKHFKQTILCLHKTHMQKFEDWFIVYFSLCCRIGTGDHEQQGSMALVCFRAMRYLEFADLMIRTRGNAAVAEASPDQVVKKLTEQEDKATAWFLSAFQPVPEPVSQVPSLSSWIHLCRQVCDASVQLMFTHHVSLNAETLLFRMELASRLWASVKLQLRIVTQRWDRTTVFSATQESRALFHAHLRPLMRSIDESTKRGFEQEVLRHAMVGGAREQFSSRKQKINDPEVLFRNLLASVIHSDEHQSLVESEESKVHGSMQVVAGTYFSPEDMKTLLKETVNTDLWKLYQDPRCTWRHVLILKVFSDCMKYHIHPTVDFIQWYYISPYMLWRRLPRLVSIQRDKSISSLPPTWSYPLVLPLLDGMYVQCSGGPGSRLIRAADMESALILFLAMVEIGHEGQLGNRISVRPLIQSCVHAQDLTLVRKLLSPASPAPVSSSSPLPPSSSSSSSSSSSTRM